MTMNLLTRESEIARLEAELATLRAQLAEANEIIYHMCNDVENNYIYIKSFVDAKNYIGKVKSA